MDGRLIRFLLILGMGWWLPEATGQFMAWNRLSEDTLYYAREYFPERTVPVNTGPGQAWDLRFLKAPFAISHRIVPIGERDGKSYGFLQQGKETLGVLDLEGTHAILGQYIEPNPLCPHQRLTYSQTPAQPLFYTGVLGSTTSYKGRRIAAFAWPRDHSCTWTPSPLPDSCRITVTVHEDIVVDGAGTLYLPTESANVLRQRVISKYATRVETLRGGRWTDVTNSVPGIRLLRQTERLRFVQAISGVMLAEIEVDDDHQVVSVLFKTHPLITRIVTEEPARPDILVYPNPTYGPVRFQLRDLAQGNFTLTIFNILGVAVREVAVTVDHPRETVSVDLSDLKRGTYLFRLQDATGRTFRTKKIVLIST